MRSIDKHLTWCVFRTGQNRHAGRQHSNECHEMGGRPQLLCCRRYLGFLMSHGQTKILPLLRVPFHDLAGSLLTPDQKFGCGALKMRHVGVVSSRG